MKPCRRPNLAVIGSLAASLVIGWLALAPAAATAANRVEPEDLFKISFVSNALISHDGKQVAFVVKRLDGKDNAYHTNIWLADVATGHTMQLTRGNDDDSPAWSPDDRWLAFVSGRKEKAQIFRIAVSGGEAEQLTTQSSGVSSPVWSNDGSRIAFLAVTKTPQPKAEIDWRAAYIAPSDSQRTSDVRVFNVLHFEDNGAGETWMNHTHIWVMHADGSGQQQLTSGTDWSETALTWSPDDQALYFNTYRAFDAYLFRKDIYTIPASGGTMRKLPLSHKANTAPTFAHKGNRLWYSIASEPDPAGLTGLVSANLDGSDERIVVRENSVAIGDAFLTDTKEGGNGCGPLFAPGEHWFIADVSVPGATEIQKFDAQTGVAQTLIARGDEIADCSMSDDGSRIAYTADDATHLGEVYVADAQSGASRQLSFLNKTYLDSVDLSNVEPFVVTDSAGLVIHAWLMRPPQAVAGRRYPTLLEIHGGPETEFGNAFFHEMQYFAGLGFNVVFSDPRQRRLRLRVHSCAGT
jgi:dipeptidyl aminopeptidase/acylaminoacyl peptidase